MFRLSRFSPRTHAPSVLAVCLLLASLTHCGPLLLDNSVGPASKGLAADGPSETTDGGRATSRALLPRGFASSSAATLTPSTSNWSSLVSRPMPSLCLDVHDGTTDSPNVGLFLCNQSSPQLFFLSASGQWVFSQSRRRDNATLCLTGTLAAGASAGSLSVAPCSNANGATWQQQGHLWVHKDSQQCLSASLVEHAQTPVSLQPCDANDIYQMWAVGNSNALAQQARVVNANVSVEDMCGGRVFIEGYDPNNVGAKRIVDRYGSLEDMADYLAQAKADNCFLMFQSGAQVPFYTDLRVTFVPQSTSAAMATDTLSRLINVYTPFWASIDESEQPFALRLDAAFHHELTHALDFLAYVPSAFVEGYANWVPYHLGLVSAGEKRAGGRWTDGYSTTAFFMVWLDDQPVSHAVGQRFTDQMREQASLSTQDPNWFFPWFTQRFGRDCNAMWQAYQTSF